MKVGVLATLLSLLLIAGMPFAASAGVLGPDSDGDGVNDPADNCVADAQAAGDFCDTDLDGYGNWCDCDYNNDPAHACGGPDFAVFGGNFGTAPANLEPDQTCDGIVGGPDFARFGSGFGAPPAGGPGPSGLACAGTTPCP